MHWQSSRSHIKCRKLREDDIFHLFEQTKDSVELCTEEWTIFTNCEQSYDSVELCAEIWTIFTNCEQINDSVNLCAEKWTMLKFMSHYV